MAMSKEDYVSYDLAQRLKEVEFEEHCKNAYLKIGRKVKLLYWGTAAKLANDMGGEYVSAPNLWQAQKWLREKKHLSVEPYANIVANFNYNIADLESFADSKGQGIGYESYECALAAGISAALELITKGE